MCRSITLIQGLNQAVNFFHLSKIISQNIPNLVAFELIQFFVMLEKQHSIIFSSNLNSIYQIPIVRRRDGKVLFHSPATYTAYLGLSLDISIAFRQYVTALSMSSQKQNTEKKENVDSHTRIQETHKNNRKDLTVYSVQV